MGVGDRLRVERQVGGFGVAGLARTGVGRDGLGVFGVRVAQFLAEFVLDFRQSPFPGVFGVGAAVGDAAIAGVAQAAVRVQAEGVFVAFLVPDRPGVEALAFFDAVEVAV